MTTDQRERDQLCFESVTRLSALVRGREISATELTAAFLSRIEDIDDQIGAFTTVTAEEALQQAELADRELARGRVSGRLHGVPVAIKDLDDVAGVRTSYGSAALVDRDPPLSSSSYVRRLTGAGAIVLGKTNVPEFGHKGVTDNALFGPTSCPFDLACNAGGSSGGSAAAVAAGLAPAAQGGDGGGSIRIPAALCGVVGVTATFGTIAHVARPNAFNAVVPFLYAGPIARTVGDAALLLEVMRGPDRRDPFAFPAGDMDLVDPTQQSVAGLRVGLLPDFGGYPVEADVRAQVAVGAAALERSGAAIEQVADKLPLDHAEITDLWIRQMGLNYLGIVEGLKLSGIDLEGERRHLVASEVLAMVDAAAARTSRQLKRDELARTRLLDWLERRLASFDVLIGATVAVSHIRNRDDGRTVGPATVAGETVDPCIGWCLTPLTNFTGHPAASVPAGLTPSGHPVGLHIVGRRFREDKVMAAAGAVERSLPVLPRPTIQIGGAP